MRIYLHLYIYIYIYIDASFRYLYISTYLLHRLDTMRILPLPSRRGRMYMVYILPLPYHVHPPPSLASPPLPSLLPWLPNRRSKRALQYKSSD